MSDDKRNAITWMAIGPWRAPAQNVREHVEESLQDVGVVPMSKERAEEDNDEDTTVPCFLVRERRDDLWLKLQPNALHPELVIRTVCTDAPNTLKVHIATATSGSSGFEANPEAFDVDFESLKVSTAGEREEIDFPGGAAPSEVPGLDRWSLAEFFVDRAINERQEGDIEVEEHFLMQSTGQDDDLEPRLANIIADVRRSAHFELDEMAGQTLIRLDLPDGTNRMSAITEDEIETITERTSVEPG